MFGIFRKIFGRPNPEKLIQDMPIEVDARNASSPPPIKKAQRQQENSQNFRKTESKETSYSVGIDGEIVESIHSAGSEHPRKSELRELSKSFGSLEATCPYCGIELAKFPQRKTKCKSCGGQIHSRKEPLSKEKRLFKESELDLFSELYELSLGSWGWWNARQVELAKAKARLSQEWGGPASQISDEDAQWSIYNLDVSEALTEGNFARYRSIKVEMVRHLIAEKRHKDAKKISPECIYLAYACAAEKSQGEQERDASLEKSQPEFMSKMNELARQNQKVYHPELSIYFHLFENISELQAAFFADSQVAMYAKTFLVDPSDVWERFARDWKEYSEALKDREAKLNDLKAKRKTNT